MALPQATVGDVYSTLIERDASDSVWLTGAGASVKSGIPTAPQLVEQAAKWAYCRSHARDVNDPTVNRSDWFPWLQGQDWYRNELGTAGNYSAAIANLLRPRENRKEFLLRILNPKVPASSGYECMADLMADRIIRTILTANFDEVLPNLCASRARPHRVESIKTPADFTKLTTTPSHPQIVYLHGATEYYTDRNLTQEVEKLDDNLVNQLLPFLRDHPLIVVGYRGGEESIMRHLLMNQAAAANYFRRGIFWCVRPDSLTRLHPLVEELAALIGGNFQLVPVGGFDELMDELWSLYKNDHRPSLSTPLPYNNPINADTTTFDMRAVVDSTIDELDWTRVQSCVIAYCSRMEISMPTPVSREWLLNFLFDHDLALRKDEEILLTAAGYLLFAKDPSIRIEACQTVLKIPQEPDQIIKGNLWHQLDFVTDALNQSNRPFRLKGTVSETVSPYPPIALKELVVNAFVHRDYSDLGNIELEIESDHIRLSNPGGLVDQVLQKTNLQIQEQVERGVRGIKGYRNPVIADIFYGAGAMDKRGSGLPDVQSSVIQNEGKVLFGPDGDNRGFVVTMYRRPEMADAITGTAVPLRVTDTYISNLLEVVELPAAIWHAEALTTSYADVWRNTGAESLPPFILFNRRLYSFSNLDSRRNPLQTQVDTSTIESLTLEEFAVGEDGERRLVYLLNESFFYYLKSRGLFVDKRRKRAYFPRSEDGDGSREVTYQARLRRATRRITKPNVSKTTNQIRYWEHEGFRFAFERYGDSWALQILPCYIFTTNGYRHLLHGPRVGPLATRRASRDYNPHVYHDLVFWTWVLAHESEGIALQDSFFLHTGEGTVRVMANLIDFEVKDIVPPNDQPTSVDAERGTNMHDVEEDIAALAEAEPQGDANDDAYEPENDEGVEHLED